MKKEIDEYVSSCELSETSSDDEQVSGDQPLNCKGKKRSVPFHYMCKNKKKKKRRSGKRIPKNYEELLAHKDEIYAEWEDYYLCSYQSKDKKKIKFQVKIVLQKYVSCLL